MNLKKAMAIGACIAACTGGVKAEEPAYTAKIIVSSGTSSVNWNDSKNWENGHVPNGADELVWIDVPDGTSSPGYQRWSNILLGSGTTAIDCFVTNGWHTAVFFGQTIDARFSVCDLSNFSSWYPIGWRSWHQAGPMNGLDLRGTAAAPSVVNRFALGNLPKTTVAGAAEVKTIYGRGFLQKEGAGRLAFDCYTGPNVGCYLFEGSLGLSGSQDREPECPAAEPCFRFDASTDTLMTAMTNGVQCVTKWADADGRDSVLNEDLFTYTHSSYAGAYWTNRNPFVSATVSPSGLRLVDFGAYRMFKDCNNPEYGSGEAPACSLKFASKVQAIKESFFAVELTGTNLVLFGDAASGIRNKWKLQNGPAGLIAGQQPDDYNVSLYLGEVRLDGVGVAPTLQYRANRSAFCVLSVRDSDKTSGVKHLGADRANVAADADAGGFRLGEVIAYTNELTEAERRQTIAYLKRKWMDAASVEKHDWSMGTVSVRGAATAIDVAEGNSAKVRLVDDTGATESSGDYGIRKTGAGELVLDRVHPSGTPISVEAGSVSFTHDSAATKATYAIAPNAAAHYDATDESKFTYADGEAKTVSSWMDANDGTKSAERIDSAHAYAVRDASGPNGKPAVSFGATVESTAARLRFPAVQAVDAFVVWKRLKADNVGNLPFIFSDSTLKANASPHWCHISNGRLLPSLSKTNYGIATVTSGAKWTVNGRICHPFEMSFGALSGETENSVSDWVVVHVAIESECSKQIDSIGATGSDYGGGCAIAELVIYDRALTDAERHDTEAALMRKWLGKDHPDDAEWSGALTFADDIPVKVGTSVDKTLSVSGGNGVLTKSGSGKLTVREDVGELAADGVTVEAGELAISAQLGTGALFHVDASEATSFVKKEGTLTGEIVRWNDVRGNGRYAETYVKDGYTVYPVLRDNPQDVTLKGGMPAVDFGNQTAQTVSGGEGAAMRWYEADGTQLRPQNLHEVHVVYKDSESMNSTTDWHGQFLSWSASYSAAKYIYARPNPNNKTLFSNKTCLYTDNTVQLLDNAAESVQKCSKSAVDNPGFHVMSIVSTNGCWADSFLFDRTSYFGGCSLCEVIVFDHTNDAVTCKAIHEHLLNKWRGLAEDHAATVPPVTVADGATLTLEAEGPVQLTSFAGAGTLKAANVIAPSTLVLDAPWTVDGELVSSGAVAVKVNFELTREQKEYTLVTAESLDVDLTQWTLVDTTLPRNRTAKFVRRGKSVVLRLEPPGLLITVW